MGIGTKRGIELFKRCGALLEGHFRLTNGNDGTHYVAKDVLRDTDQEALEEICRGIAEDFKIMDVDTVVGPESGAVKYAEYVAKFLSVLTGRKIKAVRARKVPDGKKEFFIAEEDLPEIRHKDILVVEDVFTTGLSAARVVSFLRKHDIKSVKVGGVWNRGNVTAEDLGVGVFISQIAQSYPTFEPGDDCPGCQEEILYDLKFGHGKDLVGKHPLAQEN